MELNSANYFSTAAAREYWSVSQFKAFDKCEAAGLAESRGEYIRETTDALLIGSYIDAYFSGELQQFEAREGAAMFKRNGEIYSKFEHANEIISVIESDPLMNDFLTGEHQTIMSADLFGVPWKCKFDVYNEQRIVDLKIVKDFEDIYEPGFGYRSWLEFWRYDVQGAIYTKIEQLVSGRDKPLPFFLVAATKERIPDKVVIQIPQHILDAALAMVESKIERFDLIKSGDVEPIRCGHCDYCKSTKVLKAPEVYEIEEAES